MTISINQTAVPAEPSKAKRWWRREVKNRLELVTDGYRSYASDEIRRRLCQMEQYKQAETVMLYFSVGKEIITSTLITQAQRHGKRLCLPCCRTSPTERELRCMEARVFGEGSKLVTGLYGIPEPGEDAQIVKPEDIDMVVVPCLSCDTMCARLGHGAGYYDRFLEGVRDDCFVVALCYEAMLAERLPVEAHDAMMDAVITEDKVYYRGK